MIAGDDDRQLMLDALPSACRVLYLNWAGRSQRDNQAHAGQGNCRQPPRLARAAPANALLGLSLEKLLALSTDAS